MITVPITRDPAPPPPRTLLLTSSLIVVAASPVRLFASTIQIAAWSGNRVVCDGSAP